MGWKPGWCCAEIQGFHLDNDSTDNVLSLASKRGQTQQIRSNNGSNLIRSKKGLQEVIYEWNQEKLHEFLLAKNTDWVFNPQMVSIMLTSLASWHLVFIMLEKM